MMEGFSPPLLLVLTLLLSHICTCCNAGGASSPSSDPTVTPSTRKRGPPASSGPTASPSTRNPGPPASSGPTASPSTPKPGPPTSHAGGPAASPEPGPPSSRGGGPVKSTLDPRQLSALQSMGLPTARDPCAQPSPHDNATACDNAAPFRHLVSLRLANCSPDLDISPTALHDLSTLRSLSFLHCPITPPKHLPAPLVASLQSFSCIDSLRHLSGVWLSRLSNLTDLSVINVPVAASGPWIIVSRLPRLCSVTISNANLSGGVPHYWHALGLAHVDLSANHLTGPVPTSIGMLGSLESLNLSSNSLAGVLPDAISDLVSLKIASFSQNSLSGPIPDAFSELPDLVHLDLSSNQFNGTIPKFLSGMKGLRYLNLENNNLHGVIPFNASFIKRLEVFKVGGNSNLCYNHTLLSSKLGLSIAPCDKYGLPVSPPPDRRADSSDYSGDDGDDDDDSDSKGKGGGGHHGPSKMVLGVAIALSCLVFLVIFIVCISKCCG